MIRLAFIAVLLLAGLAAFAGFNFVRSTGGAAPDAMAEATPAPQPEAAPEPEPQRTYFLQDIDLDADDLVLVLHSAGPDNEDLFLRDREAMKAAADQVYVETETSGGELAGAFVLALMGVPPEQRVVSLFDGETPVFQLSCTSTSCGNMGDGNAVFLDPLLAAAQPLGTLTEDFDDYTAYLDFLTLLEDDPDFRLLDLRPNSDGTHPVAQKTPTLTLALPTIYRAADQPLDIDTHTALLTALLQEELPQGTTLVDIEIRNLGPAVVVDADNRVPVQVAGDIAAFPDLNFYSPTAFISGASDLPAETLDALTERTWLRADFDDSMIPPFLTSIGLTCTDCYDIQVQGDVYDTAAVILRQREVYYVTYYDLRDAP